MPLTFSGTYTQNHGDEAAAGTVTVTHPEGTTGTATLDADGAYTLSLDASGGTVTIVETFTGVPVKTYTSGVTEGSTSDTGRDIGYTGPGQSGASVPSRLGVYAANLTIPLTQDVSTDAVGFEGDISEGTDITLDVDTKTIHVTAGTYLIQAAVVITGSSTPTALTVTVASQDWDGESNPPKSVTPWTADGGFRVMTGWIHFPSVGAFTVAASVHGGTGTDMLTYAGIDVVKIA